MTTAVEQIDAVVFVCLRGLAPRRKEVEMSGPIPNPDLCDLLERPLTSS
jgi:hypothetical protein